MPDAVQKIETPLGVGKVLSKEPMIFVMPEEYRGGAVGKKMAEPAKEAPKAPPAVVKPSPAPVAVKPATVVAPKRKRGSSKWLVIGGIVFVLLLAGGGFALVYFNNSAPAEEEPTPPDTRPVSPPQQEEKPPAEEVPPVEEKPPSEPFPTVTTSGKDTDSDGLTDVEETIVYSTNPRLPDTDKDGFLDGNEVFHRYNPNGTAPGTLLESGLVKEYFGDDYSVLYPSVWAVQTYAEKTSDAVFTTTTGEAISVAVEQKSGANQTLEEWYLEQNPDEPYVATTTKNGYAALTTQNKLTVYIDDGDRVLVLHYNAGVKATIEYLQTFQMMVNSVVLL